MYLVTWSAVTGRWRHHSAETQRRFFFDGSLQTEPGGESIKFFATQSCGRRRRRGNSSIFYAWRDSI